MYSSAREYSGASPCQFFDDIVCERKEGSRPPGSSNHVEQHRDPKELSTPNISRFNEDLALTRAICGGSAESWQRFLKTYCGLIYGVARRHLFTAEEDEVRNIYVDVLKFLYDGNLAKYDGRGPLASWLISVTKCRAADYIRKHNGRFRSPKRLDCLSELDQEVLRLYFAERLSVEIVIHTLQWSGFSVTAEDLVESIQRIETTVDHRYLERLEMQCRLKTSDAASVSALKYFARYVQEYYDRVNDNTIDRTLMEKEAEEKAKRVWYLVSKLPPEDRKVIELRFKREKSAQEICEAMDLPDRRKAFTVIERAVRRLKVLMNNGAGA